MHRTPGPMRDLGKGGDLGGPVERTLLGQVSQAQGRRLGLVNAARTAFGHEADKGIGVDLRLRARHMAQGQPAPEKLRRAAFILGDMRLRMTEYGAPGRRDAGQRQGIGSGTRGDKKNAQVSLENLPQPPLHPRGEGIGPVGIHRAVIRAGHRRDDFRGSAKAVVAGEVHQWPPSTT